MTDGPIETLYDLCEAVCEAITMQPNNYCQERYATDAESWIRTHNRSTEGVCGTAFCRAGWMMAILDGERGITRTTKQWTNARNYVRIERESRKLLAKAGIPEVDIHNLFRAGSLDPAGVCSDDIGTEAYVKAGIAGMRRFMDVHEVKLKAYKIQEGDAK